MQDTDLGRWVKRAFLTTIIELNSHRAFWMLLATAGTLTVIAAAIPQKSATNPAVHPRYGFQQLQERIGIAREALIPPDTECRQIVQLDTTGDPIWTVEWHDRNDHYRASGIWDAETGLLISVACQQPEDVNQSEEADARIPIGDQRSAVHAAWGWMQRLGCASLAPRWKLDAKSAFQHAHWNIVFFSNGYRVVAQLTRCDYKLARMLVMPHKA